LSFLKKSCNKINGWHINAKRIQETLFEIENEIENRDFFAESVIKSYVTVNNLIAVCLLAVYLFLHRSLGFTCPIMYFFGVHCPTCGVTRAMLSLFRLDVKGYMYYNAMALFLVSAVWLYGNRGLFHNQKMISIYTYGVLIANTAYYIFRLSFKLW